MYVTVKNLTNDDLLLLWFVSPTPIISLGPKPSRIVSRDTIEYYPRV